MRHCGASGVVEQQRGRLGHEGRDVQERHVADAGREQRSPVGGLEHPDHPGVDAGPEGGDEPAVGLRPDPVAQVARRRGGG